MNKTKRIFVAAMLVLTVLMCTMLVGCSGGAGNTPTHNHTLTRVEPKAATCMENGNREHYVCSGCDEVFADEAGTMVLSSEKYLIPAKGHNVAKHGEKAATCYSKGVKEHYECRNCGAFFRDAEGMFQITEPEALPALSHSLTKVEAQAAVGFVSGWQEHYSCSNCDKLYKDALGAVETTMEAIKIAPTLTDFEYKIAFTPAANLVSYNNTAGADYISAAYTTASDGMPATQYTFKAGATSGLEVYAWIHSTVANTMANGQNLRIPTFAGVERTLEIIVTNEGTEEISFYYYPENNGAKEGVTITLAAGETKTVSVNVNPGASTGCNYALKLLSNVNAETKVTMHGYFYCEGEVDGISMYREAAKKSFKVGEKFTTEGLVVKASGTNYDEVVIANYLTDIVEGYEFTAADVGTKTVTVAYGIYTFTYEITVSA